jgi:hypothetical protein
MALASLVHQGAVGVANDRDVALLSPGGVYARLLSPWSKAPAMLSGGPGADEVAGYAAAQKAACARAEERAPGLAAATAAKTAADAAITVRARGGFIRCQLIAPPCAATIRVRLAPRPAMRPPNRPTGSIKRYKGRGTTTILRCVCSAGAVKTDS